MDFANTLLFLHEETTRLLYSAFKNIMASIVLYWYVLVSPIGKCIFQGARVHFVA